MTEQIKTIRWVLILLGLWSWVQERDWQDRQSAQAEYTKALERTLATCLSGGDNVITVGDEVWLCGASRTGVTRL